MALSDRPDRVLLLVPGLNPGRARNIANQAVREARRKMPKATGQTAQSLQPIYGKGYFGIYFPTPIAWYQDHGIRPFTMTALEGKTIPMWVDDPTGTERAKNPKIKVRTTKSGKVQVLIFRKATRPGAPGRIGRRESGKPTTTSGRVAGAIARGNVGVKWRHPGIAPRLYLNNALTLAAQWNDILPDRIYIADRTSNLDLRHRR